MKYWDSSAILPLLVDEPTSQTLEHIHRSDSAMVVWWGAPVECASAIGRRERESRAPPTVSNDAFARLRTLRMSWREVTPSARVRDLSLRLLPTHPLRASDSLQLAAGLVPAEEEPGTLDFICLDQRLAAAARREGLTVAPL